MSAGTLTSPLAPATILHSSTTERFEMLSVSQLQTLLYILENNAISLQLPARSLLQVSAQMHWVLNFLNRIFNQMYFKTSTKHFLGKLAAD